MFKFAPAAGGQLVSVCSADSDEREFFLDDAILPEQDQEHVFNTVARGLVDKVTSGFNASCIAYGQTGAGMSLPTPHLTQARHTP